MSKVVLWIVAVVALAVVLAFVLLPAYVDGQRNPVATDTLPPVSDAARSLHDSLFVADMHADQLLWARDPLVQSARGHVDVPRLAAGNIALQTFSIVSKTPRGQNFDRNTGETDNITLLAIAQRWPVATWSSLNARALYQASRLHDAARRSNGQLSVITTREELARFVEARKANRHLVAGMLSIEGLQTLEGRLENVDTLYAAGFRMMGLTHFFDNEVGSSAHGVSHGGLTPLGRSVVQRMESLRIIVDLAHAAPKTVEETLAMATRPVVVSHTGVAATCPGPRNLTDDQLRAIARNGGLVGIGYFEGAVCGLGAKYIARAIMHAVATMGVSHVALGSDFDGAVKVPWDTRGVVRVTEALLDAGMPPSDIRAVMGENVLRFLSQNLPESNR